MNRRFGPIPDSCGAAKSSGKSRVTSTDIHGTHVLTRGAQGNEIGSFRGLCRDDHDHGKVGSEARVLHQPLIEPDDVKWRLAGQGATTVLNCAAQADIVRAVALCRVLR